MNRFFRKLWAAWIFTRDIPFDPRATGDDFWSMDDVRSLLTFHTTPTGSKLRAILANQQRAMELVAIQPKIEGMEHRCGAAYGSRVILTVIEAHLPHNFKSAPASEPAEPEATARTTAEQSFAEAYAV